jgi:serine/threonine-protein kinase
VRRIGQRYEIGEAIGSGATATVHIGRLRGTAGFTKLVAIKKLHAHLASDEKLRAILVEEARLVSRISHPGVAAVLDVADDGGEIFLVLEYARGGTLAELASGKAIPPAIAIAIVRDALAGLHAAHHARRPDGTPLELVHRDVSARNIVATTDGIGKVLDFGIARARERMSTTKDGCIRGSIPFMSPEQIRDEKLTPKTDVYSTSVVLWEALTGVRLFERENEAATMRAILDHDVRAPSTVVPSLPRALDDVVLRGLASAPEERFGSALAMSVALEASLAPANAAEVAAWVKDLRETDLAARESRMASATDETTTDDREPEPTAETVSRTRPASGTRMYWAASAAIIVLAGVAVALARRGEEVAAVAAPAPPPPPAEPVAPPSAPPPPEPTASAPAVTATPTPIPISPATFRAPPAAAPSKRAPCPPYYVDDAGMRRFNRECLE